MSRRESRPVANGAVQRPERTDTEHNALASAAVAYAQAGFAVFELQPGTKIPYGKSRGLLEATTDVETVRQWWTLRSDSNIGLRPAQGQAIIDVDTRGDGHTSLADRVIQLGPLPHDCPVAKTPTGGLHIWVSGVDAETVAKLGPGIDVKSHSGYVVAPPSVIEDVEEVKGEYCWRKPLDREPPNSPTAWADAIRKPKPSQLSTDGHMSTAHVDNEPYVNKALSDLNELAHTPAHGGKWNGRNQALNNIGLRLARLGVDREWLRGQLIDACRTNGLVADDGIRSVEKTIMSAFGKADRDGPADILERDTVSETHTRTTSTSLAGTKRLTETDGAAPEFDDYVESTTWEPVNLRPYLSGEIQQPKPCIGMARSDGLRLLYPGREHAVLGETESGKSWLALGCVAAELNAGRTVLYIHYEESDATSTIERLRLLGLSDRVIDAQLRFVAPLRAVHRGWLAPLMETVPSLVVHDGVNEAMSLHGTEIKEAEGAAEFRRRLIVPFTRAGAATLACDHLPMTRDGRRRDAYGSVHKGNALDGARIQLENVTPFGRGLRGVSYVFITKDRPGHLRTHGRPGKVPGKTFFGTLVVDDSQTFAPFEMPFYAPRDDDGETSMDDALSDTVCAMITAQPNCTVPSLRLLLAELRSAGHKFTDTAVRDTVDDLIVANRLVEVSGKRGAKGYRAITTASESQQ